MNRFFHNLPQKVLTSLLTVSAIFLPAFELGAQTKKLPPKQAPNVAKPALQPVAKPALDKVTAPVNTNTKSATKPTAKPTEKLAEKPAAAPVSQQTISSINITGQKKIEKDAIEAKLKSKVGGIYSEENIREDVKNIFKLGFFYDIQVSKVVSGNAIALTFSVVEKPAISEIVFEGNSEIKSEELLESSGLKAYEIIQMPKLREASEKLLKMYEDKGFFLAKIDPVVEDVKAGESVKLTFKIDENEKVKVKKVTFLGNKRLKDGFLKSRMMTNEGGYFSAMSGSGAYKQDVFDVDTQKLRYLYFNEGYVQVKVEKPQVYVTPDKKSIYITIRIEEGEQFDVGDIDFSGDLLYTRDELGAAIEINKKKVFSYETLQKDLGELQAKYGDLGYAFANVIPRTRINEKDRKVDVVFEFDKGNKVYFGQINVVGNSKTRDKVVRRELKIREGELYNETRRRQSLENIQRLGFFDDVNFKTSTPPEKPDQLNVDIVVKERNTGSIQVGAGYGSASGFTMYGQVNQSNFLGKGQKLSAGLQVQSESSTYNLNFTEPYFNDTLWSLGFDLYQNFASLSDYEDQRLGGAFRFGHPIGENITGTIRLKLETLKLGPTYQEYNKNRMLVTDMELFNIDKFSGETRSVTGYLEYDTRNDRFSPSKGVYLSTSLEYAGLGGKIDFVKGNAIARYFKKVFWEVVWRNNLSYSMITAPDGKEVPFMERLKLGGPYSLRGYNFYSLGTRRLSKHLYNSSDFRANYSNDLDTVQRIATRTVGGTEMALYQSEFEFPLIAEAGIKGVAFYDVGVADEGLRKSEIYSDVGFGFRWFSPIGPLRFEWGFPNRTTNASPDSVVFDFSIGSPF